MLKIIILILIFTLSGCTNKTIDSPKNVKVVENIITWESTDDEATDFDIHINGIIYTTNEELFDIGFLDNGNYDIYIIARKNNIKSSPSITISININKDINGPTNLSISEMILSWDLVENAQNYIVEIDDIETTVDNNSYSLTYLNGNKIYEIYVTAIFDDDVRSEKNSIIFSNFNDSNINYNYAFYRHKISRLLISFDTNITIYYATANELEDKITEVTFNNNKIEIPRSVIVSLPDGTNAIRVYTNIGFIIINIKITNDYIPYLISNDNYKYEPDLDYIFEFNIFENSIISGFNANFMNTNDYLIEGNKITLKSTYLKRVFEEEGLNSILLSYTLEKNDEYNIGYIIITK